MIDIRDRLRFDATRCEAQSSKGVAGNINEAADEIDRLRAENKTLFEEHRIAMNLLRENTATLEAVAAERDKLKQAPPRS